MSEDKDIYSSIYSALKHPIRRRILGMLSGRTRTFTEMQDVLGIESSHLTYHLEFLEEFISKTEDGSYMLSAFGELAVSMMKDINRTQEGKGTGKITKYWLPFKRAPYLSSIAIEKDDVWFLMSVGDFQGSHGIGQIRLKGSKAEFYQYVLGWRFKKIQSDIELKQRDAFLSKLSEENWRRIDLGITAHDGCVWYGEREGGYRRRIMTTERQALCKLHSKTHRVTRYIFPSPNELSIEYVARTLKIDSLGRRVWGTTGRNNGWVFDTSARKLRVLTIGKFIEQKVGKRVRRIPEHQLRDVAMEPNGERGWFIDFHEALYLFSLKDDSLLKYPLTGLRPIVVDLAPDGKIWCISTAHERWRDRLPPTLRRIHIGYILSLDHQTNKLTTYEIPFGYSLPAGILVTNEGIWFGNRWNMPDVDWGISKLILEGKEGSTTVITPKEVEEWKLAEYDIAEVEGEEISPKTFELHPDQLIKYEDQRPLKMVEARGKGAPGHKFLIYPIENRTPERVGEMAQDNQGRIWFTTMMSGYIGVLTPISHPIDVPR